MEEVKKGRPRSRKEARTEKFMFSITPSVLSDFRTLAFIDNRSMSDYALELMEREIKNRNAELQAFRNIQNGNY